MSCLNVIKIATKIFSIFICTSSLIMQQIFFQNQVIEFLNVFSVFVYISLESINIVFFIIKSNHRNIHNRRDRFSNIFEMYLTKISNYLHFLICIYNFYILYLLSENNFSKCVSYNIQICFTFSLIIWNFFFYNVIFYIIEQYYIRKEFKKKLSHLHIFKNNIQCKIECSICIEETKNNDIIVELNCNHVFHYNCIEPWFNISFTCPNCRKNQELEKN